MNINRSEIDKYISNESVFIGYASFEERGLAIPLAIDPSKIQNAIIFRSKRNKDKDVFDRIRAHFGEKSTEIKFDLYYPVDIAREMTQAFKDLFLSSSNKIKLIIDITTFTHETLLMMLRIILFNKDKFSLVQCMYNGADKYSIGDSLQDVWLSKGCKEVRSIIGYPGKFRPSLPSALIILTGFEQERATKLVEIFEPDKLFLGCGKDPISRDNKKIMDHFREKFEEWRKNFKPFDCSVFEFSCKSIEQTRDKLKQLTSDADSYNYIIAPLNTKLSTIAVGLVALENRRIQLCYPIPEIYNSEHYSTPGDNVIIYPLI